MFRKFHPIYSLSPMQCAEDQQSYYSLSYPHLIHFCLQFILRILWIGHISQFSSFDSVETTTLLVVPVAQSLSGVYKSNMMRCDAWFSSSPLSLTIRLPFHSSQKQVEEVLSVRKKAERIKQSMLTQIPFDLLSLLFLLFTFYSFVQYLKRRTSCFSSTLHILLHTELSAYYFHGLSLSVHIFNHCVDLGLYLYLYVWHRHHHHHIMVWHSSDIPLIPMSSFFISLLCRPMRIQ